ncbi:MAG: class I SAM-dependent methyltransferase [Alphaproteobacteria bacterium]|jgi:SAM-dependent methyltransferase|nr:class I SAM-dependent methyltransferase [Alphaproteobacteria bacterium]
MNEEFDDPRLAAIYDLLNPWAADNEFYLSLPRDGDAAVLDLGCGTGMLASAYAERGLRVVGVDPSPAMLAVARAKPYGAKVNWVEGNAQTYRSERRFDLVVMTGHAFQFLIEDHDVEAALRTAGHHLHPGGRIVFETRNPRRRAWSAWTPERSRRTVEDDAIGAVEAWTSVDGEDGDLVRFTMHFGVPGEEDTLVSTGTLRFLDRDALESHLSHAGLRVETIYGDWDRSPFSPESPEMIVVATA